VADLRRQLQQVQRDHEETQRALRDREENLAQLRSGKPLLDCKGTLIFLFVFMRILWSVSVSERVYKEYDLLKNKYEVETGAMHQAMQRASEVSGTRAL